MSSAPAGLDVREYSYGFYAPTIPLSDPGTGFFAFSGRKSWLITRIQVWADAANPAVLEFEQSGNINLAAGGCITIEPNGAFRDLVLLKGKGVRAVIEFWFQTKKNARVQFFNVDVIPP